MTKTDFDVVQVYYSCPGSRTPGEHRDIWIFNGAQGEFSIALDWNKDKQHVTLYPGENVGWQKGCNLGIDLSTAPYVVLCNDDITVKTENWLELFKEAFEVNPKLGILGPTTDERYPQGRACRDGPGRYYTDDAYILNVDAAGGDPVARLTPVDPMHVPLSFFCVAIRREVIEDVGYLDERFRYGYGADDNDYQWRAHLNGWQIGVHTGVYVEHVGGASYGETRSELQPRNVALLKKKWGLE